jgi:predicted dehydrogenase
VDSRHRHGDRRGEGFDIAASELRWGILSTADIGRHKVVPAIQAARRCRVVAVGSRDLTRGEAYARELGIPRAYGSYDEVLADPEVDAVYIPLPNHLHADWTIAAARAGKHVLCEKPLAMTAAEAQRMVNAAEEAGVVLLEAFMYRLHPSWAAVRELVAGGRIGRLSAIQSWFGYYNDDPADIRNIAEYGGGALYDIGCYCISLSRMLFGEEPIRVAAAMTLDPVAQVDIRTSAVLDFPSGSADFTCSTRTQTDQRVHIYGTRGRISVGIPFNIPPDRPTEVVLIAGDAPRRPTRTELLEFAPSNQYTAQAEELAAAVLDGQPLRFPPSDGVANMRVIDRIFEAAGVRQPRPR